MHISIIKIQLSQAINRYFTRLVLLQSRMSRRDSKNTPAILNIAEHDCILFFPRSGGEKLSTDVAAQYVHAGVAFTRF